MADIYLASRSPRRRDLLKQIGVRFEPLLLRLASPRGPDLDELQRAGESAASYVERTAREKAQFGTTILAQRSMLATRPVLAADTVVILDGDVLGKPANRQQAGDTLRRLSGRDHEVRTAVALSMRAGNSLRVLEAVSVSLVRFRKLADPEIELYAQTAEPYDKAGGYAIQGLAAVFIERIEGSYTGIMGLPLFETAQLLKQSGIALP